MNDEVVYTTTNVLKMYQIFNRNDVCIYVYVDIDRFWTHVESMPFAYNMVFVSATFAY